MFIVPLVIIYSWNHFPEPHNPKAFLILILILETGMVGTFVAQDLILFFVFFEVVLLPMYFMIGVWGGEQRQYAVDQVLPLHAVRLGADDRVASWRSTSSRRAPAATAATRSTSASSPPGAAPGSPSTTAVLIFGGMFMGFGIKVPMFPFHTWLPDAHTQAPTAGLGDPGRRAAEARHLRLHPHRHPDPPRGGRGAGRPGSGCLAVIGIIYGALGCLAQTDMKRLIAFSSVAHMGFVMLGIATLTDFGINAAIFGMVAHGLITGMLFFIAGSVKERFHTLEIKRLGGLLLQAPRMGWILGFCVHGVARPARPGRVLGRVPGDPRRPTAGRHGLERRLFRTYMVIAAIGTVFAAGYLLWLLQRVAFGTPKEEFERRAHPRHAPHRVHRLDADADPDRRARHLPEPHLQRHRRRGDQSLSAVVGDWIGRARPRARRAASRFDAPTLDWHALAPEVDPHRHASCVVLLVDLFTPEHDKWLTSSIAGLGLLAALIPVLTLAADGDDRGRCSAAPTSSTTSRWC